MTLVFIIIFCVSLISVIGILAWQWNRIKTGKVDIREELRGHLVSDDTPITWHSIAIIILYIIKHTLQFIIVEISKIYFAIKKWIHTTSHKRAPYIARAVQKLKVPPIPPTVKNFIKKSIHETKQKIQNVKKELEHLEDTIDKRVD